MEKGEISPMSTNGFRDLPKRCAKEEYVEAAQRVIRKFSSCKGFVAAYDWGNPSIPGISDLDLLIIWNTEKAAPLPFHHRGFYALAAHERYILRHPPIHIPISHFNHLQLIYPLGSARFLSGKKSAILPLSKSQKKDAALATLTDIAIRHYPRDFSHSLRKDSLHVRDFLLRLNSLRHTIKTYSLLARPKPSWERLARDIESLRSSWFESSLKDNLNTLSLFHARAYEMSLEVIDSLSGILDARWDASDKNQLQKKILLSAPKNKVLFASDWSIAQEKKQANAGGASHKSTTSLPSVFALQLMHYATAKGPISRFLHSRLSSHFKPRTSFPLLSARIEVLNAQASLANVLRHSDFPAFFDYGYRAESGLNNLALRLLDTIRH